MLKYLFLFSDLVYFVLISITNLVRNLTWLRSRTNLQHFLQLDANLQSVLPDAFSFFSICKNNPKTAAKYDVYLILSLAFSFRKIYFKF